MKKKNIFIIIIFIIIAFIVLILIGYLSSKNKNQKIGFQETEEKTTPSPSPITSPGEKQAIIPAEQIATSTEEFGKYQLLFNQPVVYIDLEYPILYLYEPETSLIKYLNLEDETYKEIAKISNITSLLNISPNKEKIIYKVDNDFYLLDIKRDIINRLPVFTKSVGFGFNKIIIYLSDNKNFSYLAFLSEDNKTTKIRDLGLLSPTIVFLPPNNVLIYNDEGVTPVFLINLDKPSEMKMFLEPKENYSILPNKKGDLLFVSSKEGSKIINLKNETLMNFPWQTTKEKCSFEDVLICGVSENFSYKDWHLLGFNIDNKIVIYDPNKKEVKEINLEEKFDVINPKLTPLGLIFGNRLNSKIYLLKI